MPDALPWILFALTSVVAALGGLQWRSVRAALVRAHAAGAESERALAGLREDLAKRERRKDDQSVDLRELRKRLEKAKRRAFEGLAEVEPLKTRVMQLEAELRTKEHALGSGAEALARADALVAKAIAERDSIRSEAERAAARVANETTRQSDETRVERDALTQRVAALDTRAGEAEREAGRYRQRWRTQQRLYMVIRGELEIAKDRIRALEGRPPRENRHLSPQIPESAETLEAEGDAELAELN